MNVLSLHWLATNGNLFTVVEAPEAEEAVAQGAAEFDEPVSGWAATLLTAAQVRELGLEENGAAE